MPTEEGRQQWDKNLGSPWTTDLKASTHPFCGYVLFRVVLFATRACGLLDWLLIALTALNGKKLPKGIGLIVFLFPTMRSVSTYVFRNQTLFCEIYFVWIPTVPTMPDIIFLVSKTTNKLFIILWAEVTFCTSEVNLDNSLFPRFKKGNFHTITYNFIQRCENDLILQIKFPTYGKSWINY